MSASASELDPTRGEGGPDVAAAGEDVDRVLEVKVLNAGVVPVPVQPDDRIGTVKGVLADRHFMCEASDVQLIHGGKLLSDDVSVSSLGVWRDKSVVHCVRRSVLKKAAAENALVRSSSARAQEAKAQSPEDARRFEEALEARRLRVKPVAGDGNCMFRSIADQIYGDEEMHAVTREMCMDYMEQNRVHFEQFIANEEFSDYIARKRSDGCFGNHPELQAFAELYCRKIEVYDASQPDAAPQDYMWHMEEGQLGGDAAAAGAGAVAQTPLPIRLSYHNGNHYNSIDDLDHSNYLDALGVPGQHGGVEKTNVDTALAQSEQEMIEKEMMASSLADSQAQDAAAEEARLVELALKDSVEEAMGRGVAVPDPGAWMGDFAAPGMGGGAAAAAADGPEGGVAAPSIGHAAGDIEQLVSMGFARDDAEVAYATFDCNLEACATYLLQEREKMAAATDYGDFF